MYWCYLIIGGTNPAAFWCSCGSESGNKIAMSEKQRCLELLKKTTIKHNYLSGKKARNIIGCFTSKHLLDILECSWGEGRRGQCRHSTIIIAGWTRQRNATTGCCSIIGIPCFTALMGWANNHWPFYSSTLYVKFKTGLYHIHVRISISTSSWLHYIPIYLSGYLVPWSVWEEGRPQPPPPLTPFSLACSPTSGVSCSRASDISPRPCFHSKNCILS